LLDDAAAHQRAMDVVPHGRYAAMAVSPLASGRLNPPGICLIYATRGQMIIFINGLQWAGYKKFEWGVVGESACADLWGRALKTGEPSLALPCFAERRYGGVLDDELLIALAPRHVPKAIEGMKRLGSNGLRYPIPQYGIQSDARAGLSVSYGLEKTKTAPRSRCHHCGPFVESQHALAPSCKREQGGLGERRTHHLHRHRQTRRA
jgi:hypothetical protein